MHTRYILLKYLEHCHERNQQRHAEEHQSGRRQCGGILFILTRLVASILITLVTLAVVTFVVTTLAVIALTAAGRLGRWLGIGTNNRNRTLDSAVCPGINLATDRTGDGTGNIRGGLCSIGREIFRLVELGVLITRWCVPEFASAGIYVHVSSTVEPMLIIRNKRIVSFVHAQDGRVGIRTDIPVPVSSLR